MKRQDDAGWKTLREGDRKEGWIKRCGVIETVKMK